MDTPNLDALLDELSPTFRFQQAACSELASLKAENTKLHDDKWLLAKPGYTYLPSEELETLRKEVARLREGAVDTFCKAARQWRDAIEEAGDSRCGVSVADIDNVFRAITKSSLLYRLIYGEGEVRTERCEKHGGHWRGIPFGEEDACCDLTGWKRGPAALRMIEENRKKLEKT